jgi:hypothetical protein
MSYVVFSALFSARRFCFYRWISSVSLTRAAGAGLRGQCRLAACPGDRILRSRIRIRSRILGSNRFAFPSLAASHLVRFRAQCASSARRRLARQQPLHQEHGIYPTSPADRVLRQQLLRLPPPRLRPRRLYASQSRPARSVVVSGGSVVVEGAPTEEPRPDARPTRGDNDPPQGQLSCPVLLPVC